MKDLTTDHASNHFTLDLVLITVLFLIATIALALRFWVRAKITKAFAYDDWLLLIAHGLNIAAAALWLHIRQVEQRYETRSKELFNRLATVCSYAVLHTGRLT